MFTHDDLGVKAAARGCDVEGRAVDGVALVDVPEAVLDLLQVRVRAELVEGPVWVCLCQALRAFLRDIPKPAWPVLLAHQAAGNAKRT